MTCRIPRESSPAEHLRRLVMPPESPTLGLTHLQFEALLTAARESANSPWPPCSDCSGCGSSKPPAPTLRAGAFGLDVGR
jgi:hypothetical protein